MSGCGSGRHPATACGAMQFSGGPGPMPIPVFLVEDCIEGNCCTVFYE
ncbi:hypothetical protein C4K35_2237 [Pseudomonas chlororaphis subsp. piscium]|nr:hypothetical protein C4K35_2237 [Pseudomonas chlororaphis subsp. piscium]AZC62612.1 hypothetical protein C4K33_2120 [Pseudomonas chlororaphis subsp. piscium]